MKKTFFIMGSYSDIMYHGFYMFSLHSLYPQLIKGIFSCDQIWQSCIILNEIREVWPPPSHCFRWEVIILVSLRQCMARCNQDKNNIISIIHNQRIKNNKKIRILQYDLFINLLILCTRVHVHEFVICQGQSRSKSFYGFLKTIYKWKNILQVGLFGIRYQIIRKIQDKFDCFCQRSNKGRSKHNETRFFKLIFTILKQTHSILAKWIRNQGEKQFHLALLNQNEAQHLY